MRAVIQRVTESRVTVGDRLTGSIGKGLLVLLGISEGDTRTDADFLAEKIVNLRIFEDAEGTMNLSCLDLAGEMLVVSQFTLLGDCRKGRRPSFIQAADPSIALPLYEYFIDTARKAGIRVETGEFGAMMAVSLVNDGPVTFILESR